MEGPAGTPTILQAAVAGDILQAARLIRDGGVVAIPTDTVYGLGASAFCDPAIERIFRIKRRAPDAPVPVLLASASELSVLVRTVPRAAWTLIEQFWPGPLTLALPARDGVSRAITRGGTTVAVRVPAGRSILLLLESLGEPVIGTSANIHGAPPATTAAEVVAQLGATVDAVLADDSAPPAGVASTVVRVDSDSCSLVREGAIPAGALRAALGPRIPLHR